MLPTQFSTHLVTNTGITCECIHKTVPTISFTDISCPRLPSQSFREICLLILFTLISCVHVSSMEIHFIEILAIGAKEPHCVDTPFNVS